MFFWRSVILTFASALSLSLGAVQIEGEKKETKDNVKLVLPDSLYKSQINFFLTREWIFGKDFFVRDVKEIFNKYVRAMFLGEISVAELHCYYNSSIPEMFDKAVDGGAILVTQREFKKRLDELPKKVQQCYVNAVLGKCAPIWDTMLIKNS